MMFINALPTIAPSAPADKTFLTCSGFEIPNPTQVGIVVCSLILLINSVVFNSTSALAPVVPITDAI